MMIIDTIITWQWINATLTGCGDLCLHVVLLLLRLKSIIVDQRVEEGRKDIVGVIIDVDTIVVAILVVVVHETHCRNIIGGSSWYWVMVITGIRKWRRLVMLT